MKVRSIPLADIDFPNHLLRGEEEQAEVDDLAFSMAKDGLLHPITLTRRGERYLLIAGFRRYRAALSLGWAAIPANILDLDDVQRALLPLTENVQRRDIDPIQEAQYIEFLIQEKGMTTEQVGGFLHKDRTTIVHKRALLNLPAYVQQALSEGTISPSVAHEIRRIPNPDTRSYVMRMAVDQGMTVERARGWTASALPRVEPPTSEELPETYHRPTPSTPEQLSTCQVCGEQKPLDDLGVIYVCPPCWEALDTIKRQQAET